MKRFKPMMGLWIPAAGTLLLFLVLSGLYPAQENLERRSVAAFQPRQENQLSDRSLVDDLSRLRLRLPIGKADWKNGALILDLKVVEEPFSVRAVYRDLAELLAFAFQDKENVSQLYLRFMAVDQWTGSRYLLLAAKVGRSDWSPGLQEELEDLGDEPLPEHLVQACHLTLTNLWLKRFAPY